MPVVSVEHLFHRTSAGYTKVPGSQQADYQVSPARRSAALPFFPSVQPPPPPALATRGARRAAHSGWRPGARRRTSTSWRPWRRRWGSGTSLFPPFLGPPARCPFTVSFLVGRVPLLKWTTEKKGTLILTSLLEDLDLRKDIFYVFPYWFSTEPVTTGHMILVVFLFSGDSSKWRFVFLSRITSICLMLGRPGVPPLYLAGKSTGGIQQLPFAETN